MFVVCRSLVILGVRNLIRFSTIVWVIFHIVLWYILLFIIFRVIGVILQWSYGDVYGRPGMSNAISTCTCILYG